MTTFDEFLTANQTYAQQFDRGDLPMPPARQMLVLTCMDARLHPEKTRGLELGDAHVVRNADGRASEDALRSVVISQRLLGTTEIVVLHHTDCGMETFTNEQLASNIKAELGVDVGDRDFLPFPDLVQSVEDDVALLRDSPLISPTIPISGAIYDVRTGYVVQVIRA